MQRSPSAEYVYPDAGSRWQSRYVINVLSPLLESLPEGASVLDIGCGNGSNTAALYKPGWNLYAVDSSQSGITAAQSAYPHIRFSLADGSGQLPFDTDSFDAVVSIETIEHVYAPRPFVANIHRLLKPGGVCLLTTPYHGYWKNLLIAATDHFDAHVDPLWDGGHIKFWSMNTLRKLLLETGFTDVQFRGAGRLPYLWKSMVAIGKKPIMETGPNR